MNVFRTIVLLICLVSHGAIAAPRHGSGAPDWVINSAGWTDFTARTGTGTCNASHSGTYTGTCKIYVANAGDDTSCTAIVATATPTSGPGGQTCATITKGTTLLRDHSDDWMLLNKGDSWTDQKFGSFNGGGSLLFCVNGISPYRPMLIGSYGTGARPLVKLSSPGSVGTSALVFTTGSCPIGANYTAWVGIEFYSYDRDPSNPSYVAPTATKDTIWGFLLAPINWMLVEDCKISFFQTGLTIQNPSTNGRSANISFRRNVIYNNYGVQPDFGQGMYVEMVDNLVLYQNIFDHNGWDATATGGVANQFSHNVYMSGYVSTGGVRVATNSIMDENIFSNDGAGNQNRNGVFGTNNLHVLDAIVTAFGSPNATGSTYNYNVVLEGTDTFTSLGWGIQAIASYEGSQYNLGASTLQNNIIANTNSADAGAFGIQLSAGANGVTVSNNIICNWQNATPTSTTGSPTSVNNLVGGSAYTDGNYGYSGGVGIPTTYVTSGAGTGLAPYIVVSGGQVTTVNIYGSPSFGFSSQIGSGYSVGDQLTAAAANIGGTGSGFSFKVAAVGTNTIGTNTTKSADCSGLGFPAPTPGGGQTLTGNYNGTLGGTATTAGFLAAARLQSRDNWNPLLTAGAHNNYVRQTGFGLSAYPYNVAPFQ